MPEGPVGEDGLPGAIVVAVAATGAGDLAAGIPVALPIGLGIRRNHQATFETVCQVRVVTSLPKVFSISVMKTGPLGVGRYALNTSLPWTARILAWCSSMGSLRLILGFARRKVTIRFAAVGRRKVR